MTPERRKEELLLGLRRTNSQVVHVCYEHVCSVLGQARTLELAESNPGKFKEAMKRKSQRSLIPEHKRVRSSSLIQFNRMVLLNELENHAKAPTTTRSTGSKPSVDSKPEAAN